MPTADAVRPSGRKDGRKQLRPGIRPLAQEAALAAGGQEQDVPRARAQEADGGGAHGAHEAPQPVQVG